MVTSILRTKAVHQPGPAGVNARAINTTAYTVWCQSIVKLSRGGSWAWLPWSWGARPTNFFWCTVKPKNRNSCTSWANKREICSRFWFSLFLYRVDGARVINVGPLRPCGGCDLRPHGCRGSRKNRQSVRFGPHYTREQGPSTRTVNTASVYRA